VESAGEHGPEEQFDAKQRASAWALIESMAWEDMDGSIRDLEAALRLALEATEDDLRRWEEDIGPALEEPDFDEFSLRAQTIAELSCEDRLAYVARLLQSLALHYGVSGFGAQQLGEADSSPAALLRGLNDILWMPETDEPQDEAP